MAEDVLHHVQHPATEIDHVVTPGSLAEALVWNARPRSKPIAGGTDLMIELDRGQHRDVETLIDLTRVPGLDRIELSDGRITIGPLVTHNQCVASDLLRRHALPLVQACLEVGSPQLRNRATIAGNIVTASPANDTLSALSVLDAELTLTSTRGSRALPLGQFHLGVRRTAMEPDELLTAISFPALDDGWRGLYLKLGLRRAQAISVVHLALVCQLSESPAGLTVETARLALGSVAPTIVRMNEAESILTGGPLDDQRIAAAAAAAAGAVNPIDDLRATADYRSQLVGEMVSRALVAIGDDSAVVPDQQPLLWGASQGSGGGQTGADFAVEHEPGSLISATVNGQQITASGAGRSLLDWLRAAGLTGVKEGCAEGECGSCTVHLDGLAVLGCLVPASRAHRAELTTIEGLAGDAADGGLHPLQAAFVDTGAVQCGFCIPGFLMAGAKLLEEYPEPTEAQIKAGLAGNLCRCTGYYKIEQAVRSTLGLPASPNPAEGGGDR